MSGKLRLWLAALGVAVVAAAAAITVKLVGGSHEQAAQPATTRAADPLIEEFRAVERATLAAYNTARREQRDNHIDELELAARIERDALGPWRAIRARVLATTPPAGREAMYATLGRYLEARQRAWEAYVAALRSDDEAAARRLYDAHREHNDAAQEQARELAAMFRGS